MATRLVSYNKLGRSGLEVSNICIGGNSFGAVTNPKMTRPDTQDEASTHAILTRFAELGGNFIDTAAIYQMGLSEKYIGTWLKRQKRQDFVIATKVFHRTYGPFNAPPNTIGLSRKNIMEMLEESLDRLGTTYIDLLQIHGWDNSTPIEETLSALNDLVRMGKVRYLGACNLSGWQLQKIVDISRDRGFPPIVSFQCQYNLLCRGAEYELVDVCRNEGIGLLPFQALKGGWLSGKMRRGMKEAPEGSRIAHASKNPNSVFRPSNPSYEDVASEETWNAVDVLETISKETGKSMAQVALRWLLQKEVVHSVIVGCRTVTQLEDNMGAASGWSLSRDHTRRLDATTNPKLFPPYDMNRIVSSSVAQPKP